MNPKSMKNLEARVGMWLAVGWVACFGDVGLFLDIDEAEGVILKDRQGT